MQNIRYIGSKPQEDAYFAETGIIWTPGLVSTVLDEVVAQRMLEHPDVFQDAGDADIAALDARLDAAEAGGGSVGTGLVVIGDSISAQGYGLVGTSYRFRNHGWWCHTLQILGWPLVVKNMAAVSGRTAQQVLAGFDSEVKPHSPSWVFGIIGQNNLGDVDGGAAAIAAINGIVAECRGIGATPVFGTVTPRTTVGMTALVKGNLFNINRAIRALGRSGEAIVFDSCAAMTDATSVDGAAKSTLLIDDLHPNAEGSSAIGRVAALVLAGKLPVNDTAPTSNADTRQINANSAQLLLNPKLAGTGGTAGTGGSGSVAASWLLSRQSGAVLAVVGSKISETGPKWREWQRMAFSGTLAGIEYTRFQQSVTVASLLTPATPGTSTVKAAITLKQGAVAPSNLQFVSLMIECLDSVPADIGGAGGMYDSGYKCAFFPATESRVETPAVVIPVGTVTLRATLRVGFSAGVASGEIDATDFELVIA